MIASGSEDSTGWYGQQADKQALVARHLVKL